MHLIRKILLAFTVILLMPACSVADISKQNENQCNKAIWGTLEVATIDTSSPAHNAYLFNCATLPNIGLPNQPRSKSLLEKMKKAEIASQLLAKGVDVQYQDKHGSTLLMSAVLSYFPAEKKMEMVKILVQKGMDWKHENKYGKTALDLAKYREDKAMVEYLSGL